MAGGAGGTGFASAQNAQIDRPTTVKQAQDSYAANQTALGQQSGLLTAIQGQNGLQNQSNVYNQLQGVANGTGPNPAQAQLAQQTGANIASQNALMAGQRGSSQNAGLIARQAAQQGANTQQQAVGQGATMQANQSLNAISAAGNMANTQAGNQIAATNSNTQAQQNEQNQLLNSINAQNTAGVNMQSNINNNNTTMAAGAQQGQQGLMGGLMGMAGGAMSLATKAAPLVAMAAQGGRVHLYDGGPPQAGQYAPVDPNNNVFDPANPPAPAPASNPAQPAQPSPIQVKPPGAASKFGQLLKNAASPSDPNAGATPNYGSRGANQIYQGMSKLGAGIGDAITNVMTPKPDAPDAKINMDQAGGQSDSTSSAPAPSPGSDGVDKDPTKLYSAHGGKVPAMVSPGEIRIHAKDVAAVAKGKKSPLDGEKIPGKAPVKGAKNDYANDIVPKDLNEGDIILPRSVTQSKNPHWAAHKFVSEIMKANGGQISMPKKANK